MKQWLPTLLIVLLCAGGIWYAAANDFFVESEDEEKGVNELVALTNENIESITIQTAENDVKLSFTDGKWNLQAKPDLRLNRSNIDGWINSLMLMVYSDVIDEKPANLADFGLDKPGERYEVKRKGKDTILVEVGDELPTGGSNYVKVNDSKAVYKVSAADIDALNKGEVDFIEKNPIVVNYDGTRRIQASWQELSFDLQMTADGATEEEKKWKLHGKKDYKHSEAKEVLTELLSWSTTVATKSVSELDTSVPDFRLTLTESSEGRQVDREYIGMIGADEVWILEKGDQWAYSINMATVQTFMAKMNKDK